MTEEWRQTFPLCNDHSRNMLMSYSSSSCEQNLSLRSSQWPSSETVMSSVQCRLQSHLYSYAATSLPSNRFHMSTQSSSTSPHQFSSAQSLVMVEILWEKDNMSETMSIRKIRIIIMFLWRDSFTHRWQQREKPLWSLYVCPVWSNCLQVYRPASSAVTSLITREQFAARRSLSALDLEITDVLSCLFTNRFTDPVLSESLKLQVSSSTVHMIISHLVTRQSDFSSSSDDDEGGGILCSELCGGNERETATIKLNQEKDSYFHPLLNVRILLDITL